MRKEEEGGRRMKDMFFTCKDVEAHRPLLHRPVLLPIRHLEITKTPEHGIISLLVAVAITLQWTVVIGAHAFTGHRFARCLSTTHLVFKLALTVFTLAGVTKEDAVLVALVGRKM